MKKFAKIIPMKEKVGTLLKEKPVRILLRLFLLIMTSILIMFFIEWSYVWKETDTAIDFAFGWRMKVFFYSAMIVFFIELIISAFFKTAWTGPAITFIGAVILSYISTQKMLFRMQPLLPEDFALTGQAGTLTRFIDVSGLIKMILACVLIFILAIVLNIISRKIFGSAKDEKGNKYTKNFRLVRVLMVVIGITGFMISTDFVRNHPGSKNIDLPNLDSYFIAWNQKGNYDLNGPVLGFLYNLKKIEVEEPDDYSKEKISEIKEKYNDDAGKNLSDSDYNIVMILNETFYDPEIISAYYPYSKNPDLKTNSMGVPVTDEVTPTLKKLISSDKNNSRVATGQMYSTDYGGGTANIEFEADTAMSNYFMNTVPYNDVLSHVKSIPSIASVAKEAGYDTVAIHPFNGGMYKRNIALASEGFDEFITENEMHFKDVDDNRPYINDRSAYKEVLKTISEHDKKTMISLITMQNHMGYDADGYTTRSYRVADIPKAGENLSPFEEDEKSQVEVFLETLHNSDYYLSEFLDSLSKSDEKTVILFYGDHSPGIFNRVKDAESKEISDLSQITPYFVWANFDLDDSSIKNKEIQSFGGIKGTTLPTTTPNCFVPTMFNLLGLKKASFINLASKVCAAEPILTQIYFGVNNPAESNILKDYNLYVYDVLSGKRYWYR